jgi:hypothetical protein
MPAWDEESLAQLPEMTREIKENLEAIIGGQQRAREAGGR